VLVGQVLLQLVWYSSIPETQLVQTVDEVHYWQGDWQALHTEPFWKYSLGQVVVQVVP